MNTGKPSHSSDDAVMAGLSQHIIRLQHVGFVVADLEASIAEYKRLYGLEDSAIRRIPDQGEDTLTRFAFLEVAGTEFELIEPVSQAFKHILLQAPSGGGGINHMAWRVRRLDEALSDLSNKGIKPGYVTPDGPVDLPDKRLVYLDPATTNGILIELLEYHSDVVT